MKELTIDLKDYVESGSVFKRTAVRGIIEREGKYLVIFSKYGDYKFPGGGMESGETLRDTLIREVQEETGYHVKPDSIKEGLKVLEKRKGEIEDIMEMESYYFFCEVGDDIGEKYEYRAVWLSLQETIRCNELLQNREKTPWVARDVMVMKELLLN